MEPYLHVDTTDTDLVLNSAKLYCTGTLYYTVMLYCTVILYCSVIVNCHKAMGHMSYGNILRLAVQQVNP